jgi:hypothetical protein
MKVANLHEEREGECHEKSASQYTYGLGGGAAITTTFPRVSADNFCGKHKPRGEKPGRKFKLKKGGKE